MRRAHFRAGGRNFNGTHTATVTITVSPAGVALFAVRPFRRRKVYELPLATVAAWTIERCVKQELAERRQGAKARRK